MSSRTSTHPQCLHGNIKLKLFDNVVCLFDTMLCYLTQQSIFGARRKFISSNDICNATSQMKYWNRNRLFFGAGIVHQTRLSDVLTKWSILAFMVKIVIKINHSNNSYWAVLSRGVLYYIEKVGSYFQS